MTRNPRLHYCDQRSDEWRALRLGKVTASRIPDLTARTQSGWSASRSNYAAELVLERLTGVITESYVNGAMQYGIEKEPEARAAYVFMTDAGVEEIGFIEHPTVHLSGCSPDGLVGDDGMIEIKCPYPATHLQTLLTKTVDGKYTKQIQWQLACAERQWCDFISYRPDFPPPMQLYIQRVTRDDVMISEMTGQVLDFLSDVANTVAKLKAQYLREAA